MRAARQSESVNRSREGKDDCFCNEYSLNLQLERVEASRKIIIFEQTLQLLITPKICYSVQLLALKVCSSEI